MNDLGNVKVFIRCVIKSESISVGKHYQVVQTIQHDNNKYFVIIDDDSCLSVMNIDCFDVNHSHI